MYLINNLPIYNDLFYSQLSAFIRGNKLDQVFVLVDTNTHNYCLEKLENKVDFSFNTIKIKSGEEYKNLDSCNHIWSELTDKKATRHSLLINLGGGVIMDMGGFCAATFKRGISFVHIPTTLLGMVDASYGGKLAVDFHQIKNHIGVFRDPNMLGIDLDYLKTLPQEEYQSGLAEIIKHALIADENLWQELKNTDLLEKENLLSLIKPSIDIKINIVKDDPFEKNIRKLLNFGHTAGHALETYSYKNKNISSLSHGVSIAFGMICETYLSTYLSEKQKNEIYPMIFKYFPKIEDAYFKNTKELWNLMQQDKKNKSNMVLSTLLEDIGKGVFDQELSEEEFYKSIDFYKKYK